MRSTQNNRLSPREEKAHELPRKKKLKTKPLIVLILILLLGNLLWFVAWLAPNKPTMYEEEVASVDGKPIMREDWLIAMEKEIGRETLSAIVNEQVMEAAAKKNDITVTDAEIDLEVALIRSVDNQAFVGLDKEKTRQRIRANLILDKVLTKDVVVDEQEVAKNYKDNKSLYDVATSYRTSIIVAPNEQDANQTLQELEAGSSFEVLAKERSIDAASASLGGDIGYIDKHMDNIDQGIRDYVINLEQPAVSGVITLLDGSYALVEVVDIMEGREFAYEEVKDYIRRTIALEQLPASVSPEAFWKEFNAKWFYEK